MRQRRLYSCLRVDPGLLFATDFFGQGKLIVGNAARTLLYTAELNASSFAAAKEVLLGLAVLYGIFFVSIALNVYRGRTEQRSRLIRLLGSDALQENINCLHEPLVQEYISFVLEAAAAASGSSVDDEASVAARVAADEARHAKPTWLARMRRRLWARDIQIERAFSPDAPKKHPNRIVEPVLSLKEWHAAQNPDEEEEEPCPAINHAPRAVLEEIVYGSPDEGMSPHVVMRLVSVDTTSADKKVAPETSSNDTGHKHLRMRLSEIDSVRVQKEAARIEAEQLQREKSKGHDELVKRLRSAELRSGNRKRGFCGRWAKALREEHGLLAIVAPRHSQKSEHLDDTPRVTGMQRSFLFLTSFLTLLFIACLAFDPEEDEWAEAISFVWPEAACESITKECVSRLARSLLENFTQAATMSIMTWPIVQFLKTTFDTIGAAEQVPHFCWRWLLW